MDREPRSSLCREDPGEESHRDAILEAIVCGRSERAMGSLRAGMDSITPELRKQHQVLGSALAQLV